MRSRLLAQAVCIFILSSLVFYFDPFPYLHLWFFRTTDEWEQIAFPPQEAPAARQAPAIWVVGNDVFMFGGLISTEDCASSNLNVAQARCDFSSDSAGTFSIPFSLILQRLTRKTI